MSEKNKQTTDNSKNLSEEKDIDSFTPFDSPQDESAEQVKFEKEDVKSEEFDDNKNNLDSDKLVDIEAVADKEKNSSPEEKYNELDNKYKRALADYQNLLKRTSFEKQDFAKYANEGIIRDILPVYDNLRVSLDHVDKNAKSNGFAEGIKYVVKQFKDVLEANGVTEINAEGKKFDPKTMEALEGKGKKVEKVLKAGYIMKDKVLVAAKVILK